MSISLSLSGTCILLLILTGHVIDNTIASFTEQQHCDGDECQNHDTDILVSAMEKAVKAMQSGDGNIFELIDDVERMMGARETFQYPPLTRIEPGKACSLLHGLVRRLLTQIATKVAMNNVGDRVKIELLPGRITHRITRAIHPPIFEIPDFLSPSECDTLIKIGQKKGLHSGEDGDDRKENDPVAKAVFLEPSDLTEDFLLSMDQRSAAATGLPIDVISRSDLPQVGHYYPGGVFHAHFDTTLNDSTKRLPCCFQAPQCNKRKLAALQYRLCCKKCIYATFIMYLNDVEDGGETAFPLADQSDDAVQRMTVTKRSESGDHFMLTHDECKSTKVKVRPKRGSAIFWYNHVLDKNGYLGETDERSYHGGCAVTKGRKWITAFTISAPQYNKKSFPSKYSRSWL